MYVKFGSPKHLKATSQRFANAGIPHGTSVRLHNKKSQQGTVINGNSERTLVETAAHGSGVDRDWYPNTIIWLEV